MGRDAMSKFAEAKELDKQADVLRKRDPANAVKMDGLARKKRGQAIKQMSKRVGKRKNTRLVL